MVDAFSVKDGGYRKKGVTQRSLYYVWAHHWPSRARLPKLY